jgi:L-fuconolactonase
MPDPAGRFVDAHVHLWDTDRFELAWLANVPRLAPRYRADDLRMAIGELPVAGAVAVQAGDSAEEAEWLGRAVADDVNLPSRVVLQYTPAPEARLGVVQVTVDRNGLLPAGIRLPVHRRDADWTDLEGLETLIPYLDRQGIVLELLLRPDQLAVVDELAAQHPRLDIVLCHLGLGSQEPTQSWQAALAGIAGRSNVSAKISGLFGRPGTRTHVDAVVRRAVVTAIEALGPDRLMFGSDWPMSTLIADYAEIVERTWSTLPELTTDESSSLWSGTAERIYRLRQLPVSQRSAPAEAGSASSSCS